jgi:hypothetical protein
MYRQCLYGVRESVWDSVSSADNQVFCRAYLLRHIASAGVDGSEVVCRDAVEGDVNSLDGAVPVDGLECPSGTSSVAVSATEAFDAFFLAIDYPQNSMLGGDGVCSPRNIFLEHVYPAQRIGRFHFKAETSISRTDD